MHEKRDIYYLPGSRGQLQTGLGEGLMERGLRIQGRATVGEFRQYSFDDQTTLIAQDLQSPKWSNEASLVITNSYGGYLLLNAQLKMPPFPGNILMLSPVIGAFEDSNTGKSYVPPYADRLMHAVRAGEYPAPRSLEIHVGSLDWQSPPDIVSELADALGAKIAIAQGRGHMLGKDYVGPILDDWLLRKTQGIGESRLTPESAAYLAFENAVNKLRDS
jgi:hypothetical protein